MQHIITYYKRYISTIICIMASFVFAGCSDAEVEFIKSQTLQFDKSTTIGKAVDGCIFLKNVSWKSEQDPQGRNIVTLSANINFEPFAKKYLKVSGHMCSLDGVDEKIALSWLDAEFKNKNSLANNCVIHITFLRNTDNRVSVSGMTVLTNLKDYEHYVYNSDAAIFMLKDIYRNELGHSYWYLLLESLRGTLTKYVEERDKNK